METTHGNNANGDNKRDEYWSTLDSHPGHYDPIVYTDDLDGASLVNAFRPVFMLEQIEVYGSNLTNSTTAADRKIVLAEICELMPWPSGELANILKDFEATLLYSDTIGGAAKWHFSHGLSVAAAQIVVPTYKELGEQQKADSLQSTLKSIMKGLASRGSSEASSLASELRECMKNYQSTFE